MKPTEPIKVETQSTVRTVVAGKWIFIEKQAPVEAKKPEMK